MRKVNLVLVLLSAALALGLAAGCKKPDDKKKPVEKKAETVLPVEIAELQTASFSDAVTLHGRLRARREARITAEIPGKLEGLPFDAGQRVGKGQTVVRLNARLAKAQLNQAEASLTLAKSTHARNLQLLDKKLATPQQVEMSQGQLDQAKAAREMAAINLSKAVVRSPIDGVIASRSVNLGEVANPGQPLLHIVDVRQVFADINVPERDIALLKEGDTVNISLRALGDTEVQGTIHRIGVTAHGKTRTFPVEVLLDNKDGNLRPGMLATVRLVRRTFDEAVVIPRDAVIDDVDHKSVFVLVGDKVQTRRVRIGPTRDAFALVEDGLTTSDALVVLGHRQVVDGQKVKVTRKAPCCKAELDVVEGRAPPASVEGAAAPASNGNGVH